MSANLSRTFDLACRTGKQVGNSLLDLVLPPACRFCNDPLSEGDFCRDCLSRLTRSEPQMLSACLRCGIPRPQATARRRGDDRASFTCRSDGVSPNDGEPVSPFVVSPFVVSPCVHCRDLKFVFDRVIPLWSYQDDVCDAVVAAKFAHRSPLADALGRRLGRRVAAALAADRPEVVTYVPSHLTRQFTRGGNSAEAIARAVSRQIRCPCRPLLRMTRRIAKQAWLDDTQRQTNVRGAFSRKKSYAFSSPPATTDRHVLLVDDVLTTGATANEVARVLRDGGAERVTLAVVARALRA